MNTRNFGFVIASLLVGKTLHAQVVDLSDKIGPAPNQEKTYFCASFAATGLLEFFLTPALFEPKRVPAAEIDAIGREFGGEEFDRRLYKGVNGLAGFMAADGAAQWANQNYGKSYALEWVEREKILPFIFENKKPVMINLKWYSKVFSKAGVAERLPTEQEKKDCIEGSKFCGGHVVLLVGADLTQKRLKFRNSWGSQWGTEGFGWLPESYILKHCEACEIETPSGASKQYVDFLEKVSLGVTFK